MHSWRVLILPFIDAGALYDRYDFSEPWDGANNRQLVGQMPNSYILPGEPPDGTGITNYLAVVGEKTAWPGNVGQRLDDIAARDGTIFIVENRGANICWMEPSDLQFSKMSFDLTADAPNGLSSRFKRIGVAMVDGSLRGLARETSPDTVRALLTGAPTEPGSEESMVEWENSRDMEEL